jgi:hypothetical protein
MGLLLKLQNGDTALKSLKFGKDRFGGGDSGQPYIKTPIIDEPGKLTHADDDFLLRGGIRAPLRALEDVARLTKYMFDPKSPKGVLFGIKQNLLSRVSPKTETTKGAAYAAGALNAGVYTPLSTLIQAGVGFTGTRVNKQGIDPTGLIEPLSIKKYEDVIKSQADNRLITLTQLVEKNEAQTNFNFIKGYSLNVGGNVIEYGGGPGSILGIGKTQIKFADQRTGVNNPLSTTNPNYFYKGGIRLHQIEERDIKYFREKNILSSFTSLGGETYNPNILISENTVKQGFSISSTTSDSLYKESENSKELRLNPRPPIDKQPNGKDDTYLVAIDEIYKKSDPLLNSARIETRVNLGDPGAVKGTWAGDVTNKDQIVDKINSSPIYSTYAITGKKHKDYNDLIAFRIGVIDNNDPTKTTYMNFRAYIDSFSDSYNSDWKAQSYMGRGEKFYKYEGFSRDISLSFTAVAQSQGEMNGMYQKLNYLASSLAPFYTGQGYMAGNLVKLTVGNYVYEQTGFISSLTYDIPQDSSWELSLSPGLKIAREDKPNPDELPFLIKVTGLKFTPIHQFRPEIQQNPIGGIGKRFITNNIPFNQNWNEKLESEPEELPPPEPPPFTPQFNLNPPPP